MVASSGKRGQGLCLWFTGLPCAGKTTIALQVAQVLEELGRPVSVLDADAVRPILSPDLGYSREDRQANLTRLAFVARELVRHGALVLVVTIAPFEEHRQWLRTRFPADGFAQVYVKASLEECERRDVKGMYRQARAGQLPGFTGVHSPYEEPSDSEIVCNTEVESLDSCVGRVLNEISERVWLVEEPLSA